MWILRAGKLGYEGLKWAFTRNLTTGKIAAGSALTAGSWAIDNATGNAASEALMDSKIGGKALEAYFNATSFFDSQQAQVIQNGVENFLNDSGKIDKSSDEYQNSDQKLLLTATIHGALGHRTSMVTALGQLKDVDLGPEDLTAAVNESLSELPEGTPTPEVALRAYEKINEQVRQQKLEAAAQASNQTVQTQQQQDVVYNPATGQVAPAARESTLDNLQDSLTSSFSQAATYTGIFAPIVNAWNSLVDGFNQLVDSITRFLSPEEVSRESNSLRRSQSSGNLQTSTNQFSNFLQDTAPKPELAL